MLPVVLVCCFLLASIVFTLRFVSSSDYRQAHRSQLDTQAAALADVAADEMAMAIGGMSFGAGEPKPVWLTELLDALEAARAAASSAPRVDRLEVEKSWDLTPVLPRTLAAATLAKRSLDLRRVRAVLGPFDVPAGRHERKLFYAEAAFGDAAKDRLPWDLRGPLAVEMEVKSAGGPFEFSHTYVRGQDLLITDTTPAGCEFALFTHMAPPDETYALNDLQRGGNLTIVPGLRGRVHVRGPLLLLPQDSPTASPFLGGERPSSPDSYPDTYWTNWSSMPGPRTTQHPEAASSSLFAGLLAQIASMLQGVHADMLPRRAAFATSHSIFETKPFSVTISVKLPWPIGKVSANVPVKRQYRDLGDISVVLAAGLDTAQPTYQTIDRDTVGYYPPAAFFYGPLPGGKQRFVVRPRMLDMVRSPRVPRAAGTPPEPFVNGGTAPVESDRILFEPLPVLGASGSADTGVLGLYGLGEFDSRTYARMTVRDLTRWIIRKKVGELSGIPRKIANAIGISQLTQIALDALSLDGNLSVLWRRFDVKAPMAWTQPPTDLTAGELEDPLSHKRAAIAPLGFTWHTERFWSEPEVPAALKQKMLGAIKTQNTPWSPDAALDVFMDNSSTSAQTAEAAVSAGGPRVSEQVREWMSDQMASRFLVRTAGADATDPFRALRAILDSGLRGGLRGVAPLSPRRVRRPQGAFGELSEGNEAGAEELTALARDYPNGYFPPQFRDWERVVTRSYPDMQSYLDAESTGGILRLKGAVLIRRMRFPGPGAPPRDITYSGRGAIVAITEDENAPSTLDARVRPAPGATESELILAHRVSRPLLEAGKRPPLLLGSEVVASVSSDTGVAPVGSATTIRGNLVTGLLNKQAIGPSSAAGDGVTVRYRPALEDDATGSRVPFWTVELGGEATSWTPDP